MSCMDIFIYVMLSQCHSASTRMQHFSFCKAVQRPKRHFVQCWAQRGVFFFLGRYRKGGAGKHKVALIQDLTVCIYIYICACVLERGVHTLACCTNSVFLLKISDECSVESTSVKQLS